MSHHNRFLSEEILTPYKEALSVYPASLSPERLYDISEEQQRQLRGSPERWKAGGGAREELVQVAFGRV